MRLDSYCKSIDNGVISDTPCNASLTTHDTRQKDGLYVPSIKTNVFLWFCPDIFMRSIVFLSCHVESQESAGEGEVGLSGIGAR